MTDISSDTRRSRQPAIRFDPRRTRGEADFASARRHSRRVRTLRIALPIIAVLALAGFLYAARAVILDAGLFISLKGLNLDTKSLTIDAPHVSGFQGTAQAYEVRAESAVQDLTNPRVVTLNKIDAKFGMAGANSASVNATTGVYDGSKDSLQLSKGITVTTADGYKATLQDALVDLKAGSLVSTSPVQMKGPAGTVTGNRLTIVDRGKKIVLDNGVHVTYTEPPVTPARQPVNGAPTTP
jgi:lipopolysaccharide export system protein LptC